MPRIPRLALALFLLPLSAGAAIVPGPEVPLTEPIVESSAFSQSGARIAAGDDGFLAVWTDESVSGTAVLGALLRADGTRIDDRVLAIGPTPPSEGGADVVFGAGRYFVAWMHNNVIFGRFVMPDGTMSEAFRLSVPPQLWGWARPPQVTFNGKVFLAGWREYSPNATFAAAIVDPVTAAVKTIDLGLGEGYMDLFAVAAANGAFHFATWRLDSIEQGVGLTVINPDGTFTARQPLGPPSEGSPSLMAATGAGDALFAWTSTDVTTSARFLHSVRVGENGRPETTQSFEIAADDHLHAVVADRDGYLLFYGSTSTTHTRRADSNETFTLFTLPDSRLNAGATAAAGTILVTEARGDLYVHRLESTSFMPLVTAERHQTAPDIAAAGTTRLAAWAEWNAATRRYVVAGARVDGDGRVLDPVAIEIGEGTDSGVRIASNGSHWLVVWLDGVTVKGARVARNGEVLDATPITIAMFVVYSKDVEVAWDGSSYVVVYVTGTPTRFGSMMTIRAARVTADGKLLTPDLPLSLVGANFEPAIAVSPAGSLVTWTNTRDGTVEGALLSRSNSVTRIAFPNIGRASFTAAAWNSETGTYLVAAPFQGDGIRWYFVNANGVVTSTSSASIPWKTQAFAPIEVQPFGTGFLLTYLNDGAIRAAVINRAGWIEEAPVILAVTPHETRFGTSGSTVVYARPTEAVRDRLSRVFLRELQVVPDPPRRRAVR